MDYKKAKAHFSDILEQALTESKKLGATEAVAEIDEGQGMHVTARLGHVETVQQTHDRSLAVSVYCGKKVGLASTSDFSIQAIKDTVAAAYNIAKYTSEDPASGLPEPELLATHIKDLKLYKPWKLSTDEATDLAIEIEEAALQYSPQISNSDGATVSTSEGHFMLANTHGFMEGYRVSGHSLFVSLIAGHGDGMQTDCWHSSSCYPEKLPSAKSLGEYAAQRTLARLNARRIPTGNYPVLFEAPVALGLLGALTQAISGGALYRKASFLVDSLGQSLFPDHIQVYEDPFILGATGSSYFDNEGVRTQARYVVQNGIVEGYFLSCYSARKLGMISTGNSGGSHNLHLYSSKTQKGDNFEEMLRKLDRGLLVTSLMGQGVNYVTGDYSRGAFGYWVENGKIQYPVQEITIAGNLRDMYRQIVAVGCDEIIRGTKKSGSILIENMAIAGV